MPGSAVSGTVDTVLPMGSEQYLSMTIEGTEVFFRLGKEHKHKDGDSVSLEVNRNRLHVFDKETRRSMLWG
jgi:multiple sugar transport system ATP-binding protein